MPKPERYSTTHLSRIYFWTATIHNWLPLLEDNANKEIIIQSLRYLSSKGLITVYAFVIMPNHIHLIWRLNELNGKETAKGSFMKYTAHELRKKLVESGQLQLFRVQAANKAHEIWQRDAMAIEIYYKKFAKQKLDYIHLNPIRGKWDLSRDHLSYYYSSIRFYEFGIDEFGFLNNILWEF